MALGSTQPLTEMSTRNIFWGKGGRYLRLTAYHLPVPLSRNLDLETSGPLRACKGTALHFTARVVIKVKKFVPEGCHLFPVLEHSVGRRRF